MVFFSNCKINLGLHITGKRPDGYHNLETVFFPLPLYDVLEVIPSEETAISLYGLSIPGSFENNIILKAYQLLKNDFLELPPVHFHLLKNIPAGAGLGAGSANGAATLQALNSIFNLKRTVQDLMKYALRLGSDCPFFILNEPCFATGRGELLTPISLRLDHYKMVIINPGIHISTPWAFSRLHPASPKNSLENITELPVHLWNDYVTNDFEKEVFKEYPEIKTIKEVLKSAGAEFSAMTGSGSTVFGLFKTLVPPLSFPDHYFIKQIDLKEA